MNQKAETYTPILPYDITYGESFKIYDNEKYIQDKALCGGDECVRMTSGNVYKYYTTHMAEPYKVGSTEDN